MAHFRRKKPRNRTYGGSDTKGNRFAHWPAWWDRLFHIRPARQSSHRLERDIVRGYVDPDDAIPEHVGNKPHRYYW